MSKLIVQKFGGSSVSNGHVASNVSKEISLGNRVVVVVSAFAGITDALVNATSRVLGCNADYKYLGFSQRAEIDAAISSGEQNSAALVALSLLNEGVPARSFMGWQCPIYTNEDHCSAHIEEIHTQHLLDALNNGITPVVAGFQGIARDSGRITTLGRGGSDYSAVALAVALKADRCDIYKDVEGIYSVDPNFCPRAKFMENIDFTEILELSSAGSKVLQKESVLLAMVNDVRLRVRSSATDKTRFTDISNGVDLTKSLTGVKGIAKQAGLSLIKIIVDNDILGFMGLLSRMGVIIDMLSLNKDNNSCVFVIPDGALLVAKALVHNEVCEKYDAQLESISGLVKLTIVGLGIKSDPQKISLACEALSSNGYSAYLASSCETGFSFLIDSCDAQAIANLWIDSFGLSDCMYAS